MRIHLLGLPNAQTTAEYALCGFTQATIRFARMMKALGHYVILYGSEENEAPCDEFVTVITKEEQAAILNGVPYQYATMNEVIGLWQLSNTRMINAIGARKQPHDLLCLIGGLSQKPVVDAHPDLMDVEYSIGYIGSFARHRVFESHVWRHCTHGYQDIIDGRYFDDVIPLSYDPAEFPFVQQKSDFALYVGRLVPKKGVETACEAAALAGVKLKVIGHGDPALVTHGAEYLGPVTNIERNDWMARAFALICPTIYVEPFGAISVEAQMCGTPVISPDFGGFVETVEHGKTGFRCHYLGEFAEAFALTKQLDPAYIRQRAERLYSFEAVQQQYQRYFERLDLLWEQGWMTGRKP